MNAAAALSRRLVFLGSAAAIGGCAVTNKAIVLDKQAMTGIRSVAVVGVGMPDSPSVTVVNSAGNALASFGLIGLVAMTADLTKGANRRAALREMMASAGSDPQAYLQAGIEAAVKDRGLAASRAAADPARHAFLPAVPPGNGADVLLDSYVTGYGFIAASDADKDPFRPTVSLSVQLVNGRDSSVMMRDVVLISVDDAPVTAADGTALGKLTFPNFSDVEREPKRALAGLRYALDQAAAGVAKRLA